MGKIKKILENELVGGAQTTDIYPVTSIKAVYDENNKRLDNILTELKQSEGVYNVSANNAGAVFESLQSLLNSSNLSTLIPTSVRRGGMIIRFIQGSKQSSDNKYVQYRLMTTSFSTNEVDWQGVDNEPTLGSTNLVKSGGVYLKINQEKQRAETSEQRLQESIDSVKEETLEENRQMVNSIMENYAPIEITGNVNNAADEEDLTSVNVEGTDVLKFKDKVYNHLVYSGLGRKILRKNIVNGVNTLTQSMINQQNTIYVIQYDFTLGENINVPANCIFEFDGGSVSGSGSNIITFTNTLLSKNIKFLNVVATGTIANNSITPKDFGALGDGVTNDTVAFQSAINVCNTINVPNGTFIVTLQRRGKSVNETNGICINRSNVHIKMGKDTIIRGKVDEKVIKPATGFTGYSQYFGSIIKVESPDIETFIENITIEGGCLIGARSDFAEPINGATEENQNGIVVRYTKNCIIKDCIIQDNQGDSIIAYNNKDISIKNITSINARRTGISIGPCNGFFIDCCKFINNGCDTLYNGNIKYATGPQAGICFEGDTSSTIVEKKFNNVIIQNCYCEYDSYLTPPSDYVFVARNSPEFVLIGNLANGADKIVVRNCEIKNIQAASSSAFIVSSKNTKCKNLYFIGNTYQSLVDGKNSASMFLLISSDIDNILIEHNTCTTNTRMSYIHNGEGKFGNITISNNSTLKVDGHKYSLYDFDRGKVNNLTISHNYSNGSINNSWVLKEINELNIINNYFEINSPNTGGAIVKLVIPGTATARFINNIYKVKVPLDYTFNLFAIHPEYLDDNNNIVDASISTKLGGAHLDFINNTVSIEGSKNVFFSAYPYYISGLIANNIIKVSDVDFFRYGNPSKPLAKELYIHNNIFDNRGNKHNVNIIENHIENVFNFDNIYLGNKTFGDTLNTPKKLGIEDTGYPYYDKSLNYPIWWNGTNWVDSEGNKAFKNRGTTNERPTLTSTNEGFEYYDTTLKKKILWNGTTWVNIDGTNLI